MYALVNTFWFWKTDSKNAKWQQLDVELNVRSSGFIKLRFCNIIKPYRDLKLILIEYMGYNLLIIIGFAKCDFFFYVAAAGGEQFEFAFGTIDAVEFDGDARGFLLARLGVAEIGGFVESGRVGDLYFGGVATFGQIFVETELHAVFLHDFHELRLS